jgi:hypothetical protein
MKEFTQYGPWVVGDQVGNCEFVGLNSETGQLALLQLISKVSDKDLEIYKIFSDAFIEIYQVFQISSKQVLIIKELKTDFSLKEIKAKFQLNENIKSKIAFRILNILKEINFTAKGFINLENLKVNGSVLNIKIDPFKFKNSKNDLENLREILMDSNGSELLLEFLQLLLEKDAVIQDLLNHSWILLYNQGKSVSFSPVLKSNLSKSLDLDRSLVTLEEFKFTKKRPVCVIS